MLKTLLNFVLAAGLWIKQAQFTFNKP